MAESGRGAGEYGGPDWLGGEPGETPETPETSELAGARGRAVLPIRHGQLPKPRPVRGIAKGASAVVAILIISAVLFTAIAAWNLTSSMKPGVDLIGHTIPPVPMIGALRGEINILLAGSDSAEDDPIYGPRGENLNDVTMLLHVSPDHTRATVVSFPRDMFVPIPGCPNPDGGTFEGSDSAKLNTSLSHGGLPCTVHTIEQLTGLSIPYAALIQFQGLIAMSNAVGGVPVCVAKAIEDVHQPFPFVLDQGSHVLKGDQALAFLRTRYGLDTGSDLARSSNQRVFLSSLFRTIRSKDTLGNPVKVYSLADAALDNMTFSKSLGSVPTMVAIAVAIKDIQPDNMLLVQYPTDEVSGGLEPRLDDAQQLFNALQGEKPLKLRGGTGAGASPAPESSPPASSHSSSSSPSPSTGSETELPASIQGQTAAQETCSVGRPLSDQ